MFEKAGMDVKEPTYAKFKEAVMILISNTSNFEEGDRKLIIDMFNRMPQEPTNESWAEIAWRIAEYFWKWTPMGATKLKELVGPRRYMLIINYNYERGSKEYESYMNI